MNADKAKMRVSLSEIFWLQMQLSAVKGLKKDVAPSVQLFDKLNGGQDCSVVSVALLQITTRERLLIACAMCVHTSRILM